MNFRILYIVPDFYPNLTGYANACLGMVEALDKFSNTQLTIVTFANLNGRAELIFKNHKVVRLKTPKVLNKTNIIKQELIILKIVNEYMSKGLVDFVYFETVEFPISIYISAKRFGNKIIARIHACAETEWILYRNRFLYLIKRFPTILAIRNLYNIFFTSSYYIGFVKDRFLKNDALRISAKYFSVLSNIVPCAGNSTGVIPFDLKLSEKYVFLTLGRLDSDGELQKNFSRLLIAISLLREMNYFEKIQLLLVGQGNFKRKLVKLVNVLNLKNNVIFIDQLENPQVQFLQKHCHGVVLASTFEGQSMFALESLSNSAPLLLSGEGGLESLVIDKENGVVFNALDPHNIASKLDVYITDMLPNIDNVRRASRQLYETKFKSEKVVIHFHKELNVLWALSEAEVR